MKDESDTGSRPPWAHDSQNIVICHYFNWFKTPDGRGSWHNWEWKGKGPQHDPNTVLADGRRDIASVFYPRIGPYDSSDRDVIEYHMLSALSAKIDGFFIDWYGIPSETEQGFPALLEMADRLGFKMCICFEDKAMFGYHYQVRTRREAIDRAVENMNHILEQHAAHPAYLRIDGVPVVINFSWSEPIPSVRAHGFSAADWKEILRRVREKHAVYFVHDYHCHLREQYWDVADNMYNWVDVNGECLDRFYAEVRRRTESGQYGFVTALVYPGFDNTGVWGWGDGPFVTPREDGAFYRRSWERALEHDARFIQIATWNDFGEGATIEPTVEYEFQYLALTEEYAARAKGLSSDGAEGAPIAHALYSARKAVRSMAARDAAAEASRMLDRAAELFLAGEFQPAADAIASVLAQSR